MSNKGDTTQMARTTTHNKLEDTFFLLIFAIYAWSGSRADLDRFPVACKELLQVLLWLFGAEMHYQWDHHVELDDGFLGLMPPKQEFVTPVRLDLVVSF